jgi:hypothetical protein
VPLQPGFSGEPTVSHSVSERNGSVRFGASFFPGLGLRLQAQTVSKSDHGLCQSAAAALAAAVLPRPQRQQPTGPRREVTPSPLARDPQAACQCMPAPAGSGEPRQGRGRGPPLRGAALARLPLHGPGVAAGPDRGGALCPAGRESPGPESARLAAAWSP